MLDRADGLGDFAEIETLAATESDLPAAQAAVLALANELGLTEVEPRSYLRMSLEARMNDQSRPGRLRGSNDQADGSGLGPRRPFATWLVRPLPLW